MNMKINVILCASISNILFGCITRAPTTYELDRRAGFSLPKDSILNDELAKMRTSSNVPKAPMVPVRIPPVIEKVWVADASLGEGAKMQGTWMFLEVEPGKWFEEVDLGSAPIVFPPELDAPKPPKASQKE
jgi:hypothetical protein